MSDQEVCSRRSITIDVQHLVGHRPCSSLVRGKRRSSADWSQLIIKTQQIVMNCFRWRNIGKNSVCPSNLSRRLSALPQHCRVDSQCNITSKNTAEIIQSQSHALLVCTLLGIFNIIAVHHHGIMSGPINTNPST